MCEGKVGEDWREVSRMKRKRKEEGTSKAI